MNYKRIAQIRTVDQFRDYCESIGADIPIDDTIDISDDAPLKQPHNHQNKTLSNPASNSIQFQLLLSGQ
jgi:hypothetical protein